MWNLIIHPGNSLIWWSHVTLSINQRLERWPTQRSGIGQGLNHLVNIHYYTWFLWVMCWFFLPSSLVSCLIWPPTDAHPSAEGTYEPPQWGGLVEQDDSEKERKFAPLSTAFRSPLNDSWLSMTVSESPKIIREFAVDLGREWPSF